jgi:hypothetical protein
MEIFDNGHHTAPVSHSEPFNGILIFTPGALLRNGRSHAPADWAEVVLADGHLNRDGYYDLYERRLLPVFQHVNVRRTPKFGPGVKLGLWWSGAGLEPKLNHTK